MSLVDLGVSARGEEHTVPRAAFRETAGQQTVLCKASDRSVVYSQRFRAGSFFDAGPFVLKASQAIGYRILIQKREQYKLRDNHR